MRPAHAATGLSAVTGGGERGCDRSTPRGPESTAAVAEARAGARIRPKARASGVAVCGWRVARACEPAPNVRHVVAVLHEGLSDALLQLTLLRGCQRGNEILLNTRVDVRKERAAIFWRRAFPTLG